MPYYNMVSKWNKNGVIEGLENQSDISGNNLDLTQTYNNTRATIQTTLDVIKAPILNSTDSNDLPPNTQHETQFYTAIRENIAKPFVKSFITTSPTTSQHSPLTKNSDISGVQIHDISGVQIADIQNINANINANQVTKEGFNIGDAGDVNLNLGNNETINDILNEDTELLNNSQNVANIIYFCLILIPLIYVAWFNWMYYLIPIDYFNLNGYIDQMVNTNGDPTMETFKNMIKSNITRDGLYVGFFEKNSWKLYEYIHYLTSNLTEEEHAEYEGKYGPNKFSKLNGTIYEPVFIIQMFKYLILPIYTIDILAHKFYGIFQFVACDSYILGSILFLFFMFIFFYWGALQSDFFTQFTESILSSNIDTIPFSVGVDGSLNFSIFSANAQSIFTINAPNGGSGWASFLLSSFQLLIFVSFLFFLIYDFGEALIKMGSSMVGGSIAPPQLNFITGFWFILKWAVFGSFIFNFTFLIYIIAWIYLIVITLGGGYWFSSIREPGNFVGDLFGNTYSNILKLDLLKYDLVEKVKGMYIDGYQKTIDSIVKNMQSYHAIEHYIVSWFKLTEDRPRLWSIIIFLLFAFFTLLIETSQISNVTIAFFVVNLILLLMLFAGICIIYFVGNMTEYIAPKNTTKIKEIFKNSFERIVGNKSPDYGV